jgi:hypothetical protein
MVEWPPGSKALQEEELVAVLWCWRYWGKGRETLLDLVLSRGKQERSVEWVRNSTGDLQ